MATLVSPGVSVTVTDESQYLPAAGGTVPLIVLATAQNKADASGTAVAVATTAANAGKLFNITSQRDLVNYYGSPFFYSTTAGTPIHGYELNEYGLLAAYSLLGVTNSCYILRADIDLASLVGKTSRPTGAPENGTYWLDTVNSTWGIYEFNAATGKFTNKIPTVITDAADMSGSKPKSAIGNLGDYAVNAIQESFSPTLYGQYFYKTSSGAWQVVGSDDWAKDIPTVLGSISGDSTNGVDLTAGHTLTIDVNGVFSETVAVPAATNDTALGLASAINGLDWKDLTAGVTSAGKFYITLHQPEGTDPEAAFKITISGSGTVLADLGLPSGTTDHYQAAVTYGTSSQMPLWTTSQTVPRPTGSVWIKVGSAGNGLSLSLNQYISATSAWLMKDSTLALSDWNATAALDATGGRVIPAGTVYTQYGYNDEYKTGPVYLWERLATGPTVVTGTTAPPAFSGGPKTFTVNVSVPGGGLDGPYTVTVQNGDGEDFVSGWVTAAIPYTTASVTSTGAIQLVHSYGGEMILNDYSSTTGDSNGVLDAAGFIAGTTGGCKYGPGISTTFSGVVTSGGSGTGCTVHINSAYGKYSVVGTGVTATGTTTYVVGEQLTVLGTALGGATTANDLYLTVTSVNGSGGVTSVAIRSTLGASTGAYSVQLSNWVDVTYEPNQGALVAIPLEGATWFYSVADEADIMVNKAGGWIGYGKTAFDNNGFPLPSSTSTTDPAGPIVSASEPTLQTDGTDLVPGDLWIDTSDLENYPKISRWQLVDSIGQWVAVDNTDQVSSTGILFADARWATVGTVNPANDPLSTIPELLASNYLDLDAPNPDLYPQGMLLFNTRRSGYNVKQFRNNYFNAVDFPGDSLPTERAAWVSISGLQEDGSPYMGRKAQRSSVIQAMNAAVSTNTDIRSEDNYITLMAAPGYPELQPSLVTLNNDRGMTAFIVGDTPMRLAEDATGLANWAQNVAGASVTGDQGCVTRDTNLGIYYPSGITTDLSGNAVAVPASHMMLRTFIRSDAMSYPWLAAAGIRRGTIDNANNIGYINATTGEFQTTKVRLSTRDVLYANQINALTYFTGTGLLNYGNKTSFASSSALDRVNVARLINYIRYQLVRLARPYVFEPNDAFTRQQVLSSVNTFLHELVTQRGLYDFLVVCDDSNNTPARIDRSELWVDVAIEPVKAAEFIYIPVRVLNTGELSGNKG